MVVDKLAYNVEGFVKAIAMGQPGTNA